MALLMGNSDNLPLPLGKGGGGPVGVGRGWRSCSLPAPAGQVKVSTGSFWKVSSSGGGSLGAAPKGSDPHRCGGTLRTSAGRVGDVDNGPGPGMRSHPQLFPHLSAPGRGHFRPPMSKQHSSATSCFQHTQCLSPHKLITTITQASPEMLD